MTTDIRNLALQLRAWSEPIASGYEVPAAARTLHAAADALEAMAGEVERLTINGIHSCWEECPRLPCVQGREIRALTAERDRLAGEVAIVRSARDMHHANYELMKAHNKELFGKLSDAETERDRLKAALEKFIAEANTAPKRIIGNGIGGQTMEATLKASQRQETAHE